MFTGPGSVKDQIKLINEKFAEAAQWQGQEIYPLPCYYPTYRRAQRLH